MIALLPIKHKSQRVANKNFRILNGKPLFVWVLMSLIEVDKIERVLINTDAPELVSNLIKDSIDRSNFDRVTVKPREFALCGHLVSMNKIIFDDIAPFPNKKNFFMTHATNPFLSRSTIVSAIEKYERNLAFGYDSLFSVNRIQNRAYTSNLIPINHNPDELIQTQDLDPIFVENSCFYVFSKASFQKNNNRIGASPGVFPLSLLEAIDIDTEKDWDDASLISTIMLD